MSIDFDRSPTAGDSHPDFPEPFVHEPRVTTREEAAESLGNLVSDFGILTADEAARALKDWD